MHNVATTEGAHKFLCGERPRYERGISRMARIRRFLGGDCTATYAALQYVARFKHQPQTLWIDGDDVSWIAQPIRCFAEELDLSQRAVIRLHERMVELGALEVVSRRLYAGALRRTTHVRLTDKFVGLLHEIGWWVREGDVPAPTYVADDIGTHVADDTLMESTEGSTISLCESKSPAPPATGEKTGCNKFHKSEADTPALKSDKDDSNVVAFKGGMIVPRKKTLTSAKDAAGSGHSTVQEALSAASGHSPTSQGRKAALWAKTAAQIRSITGSPFPMRAPPAMLARLWRLRQDMRDAYDMGDEPFEMMIETAAEDWPGMIAWMGGHSSMVNPDRAPASIDLMWLQFHRDKAYEYARARAVGANTGAPVAAQEGTAPTPGGFLSQAKLAG